MCRHGRFKQHGEGLHCDQLTFSTYRPGESNRRLGDTQTGRRMWCTYHRERFKAHGGAISYDLLMWIIGLRQKFKLSGEKWQHVWPMLSTRQLGTFSHAIGCIATPSATPNIALQQKSRLFGVGTWLMQILSVIARRRRFKLPGGDIQLLQSTSSFKLQRKSRPLGVDDQLSPTTFSIAPRGRFKQPGGDSVLLKTSF